MKFQITLNNGKSFDCLESQTIYEGARSNGIVLDHSCLTARCSACKVQVLNGHTVDIIKDNILTEEQREKGYVLSCNCKPITDLKIDAEDLTDYDLVKPKTVPAKISSIEHLTQDVLKIILRTPPRQKIEFLNGQFVDIIKGSTRRSYSVASTSRADGSLEFFIKNYPGGMMSNYLFNEAQVGDLLRVEGPKGTFFLRNLRKEKLIFLATGTGIAPINAILEGILQGDTQDVSYEDIIVFWGVRNENDFFDLPTLKHERIKFYPVLSRPTWAWQGNTGYVQDVACNILGNFATAAMYACGSDEMIKSARMLAINNDLDPNSFYADAFVPTN